MRENLKEIEEIRTTFTATFIRFGSKKGYKGPIKTLLFNDVTNTEGKIVSEHIWFTSGKQFESLDLIEDDKVQFDARVKEYTKGYFGYREDVYKPVETDYKLSHPTKVKKL